MTIPDFQSLLAPILRDLSDGDERAVSEVANRLAVQLGLDEAALAEMIPSQRMTTWRSRVHWAAQYLYQAGAVSRPRRGVISLAQRGRELLGAHPDGVRTDDLMQFAEFRDFKVRARSTRPARNPTSEFVETVRAEIDTPHDRIAAASAELDASLAADLLKRINDQRPAFLERVVLDLLVAMGYTGALGSSEHLGRTADEGVDGVLNQDVLGLDRIYVQAKRYGSGRTVGRPDIQGFVGALHGAQASRGVFITTSRFSREARDYTKIIPQRLVLIDGEELTSLMVQHGVGVQPEQTIVVRKLDEDFFE